MTTGYVSVAPGTQAAVCIAGWIESEWPGIPIIDWLRRPSRSKHNQTFPVVLGYLDPEEKELCASGALLLNDMEDRPNLNPWLGCLYVLPHTRHRGIARKLVHALVAKAKAINISNLYLFCHPRLHSFYASEGWRTIENRIYEGEPCIVMERKFDDP